MNKLQTLSISMLLTATIAVVADESIDAQIQKIQNASPAKGVKLMNQFKQKLRQMNQEQREDAISKLRASNKPALQDNVQNNQNDSQLNIMNNTQQMNQQQIMQQWNKMGQPAGGFQPGNPIHNPMQQR